MQIRVATPNDLPILREFEQGIVVAERPFDETLRPDPITYHDIESLMDSPDAEIVIAELDNRPIGCGFAQKRASRHYTKPAFHAHIGCMYVEPNSRGRGVTQRILDRLLEWANDRDLIEIRLTVYPDNAPAIRAYEKAGFQPHLLEMRMGLADAPDSQTND